MSHNDCHDCGNHDRHHHHRCYDYKRLSAKKVDACKLCAKKAYIKDLTTGQLKVKGDSCLIGDLKVDGDTCLGSVVIENTQVQYPMDPIPVTEDPETNPFEGSVEASGLRFTFVDTGSLNTGPWYFNDVKDPGHIVLQCGIEETDLTPLGQNGPESPGDKPPVFSTNAKIRVNIVNENPDSSFNSDMTLNVSWAAEQPGFVEYDYIQVTRNGDLLLLEGDFDPAGPPGSLGGFLTASIPINNFTDEELLEITFFKDSGWRGGLDSIYFSIQDLDMTETTITSTEVKGDLTVGGYLKGKDGTLTVCGDLEIKDGGLVGDGVYNLKVYGDGPGAGFDVSKGNILRLLPDFFDPNNEQVACRNIGTQGGTSRSLLTIDAGESGAETPDIKDLIWSPKYLVITGSSTDGMTFNSPNGDISVVLPDYSGNGDSDAFVLIVDPRNYAPLYAYAFDYSGFGSNPFTTSTDIAISGDVVDIEGVPHLVLSVDSESASDPSKARGFVDVRNLVTGLSTNHLELNSTDRIVMETAKASIIVLGGDAIGLVVEASGYFIGNATVGTVSLLPEEERNPAVGFYAQIESRFNAGALNTSRTVRVTCDGGATFEDTFGKTQTGSRMVSQSPLSRSIQLTMHAGEAAGNTTIYGPSNTVNQVLDAGSLSPFVITVELCGVVGFVTAGDSTGSLQNSKLVPGGTRSTSLVLPIRVTFPADDEWDTLNIPFSTTKRTFTFGNETVETTYDDTIIIATFDSRSGDVLSISVAPESRGELYAVGGNGGSKSWAMASQVIDGIATVAPAGSFPGIDPVDPVSYPPDGTQGYAPYGDQIGDTIDINLGTVDSLWLEGGFVGASPHELDMQGLYDLSSFKSGTSKYDWAVICHCCTWCSACTSNTSTIGQLLRTGDYPSIMCLCAPYQDDGVGQPATPAGRQIVIGKYATATGFDTFTPGGYLAADMAVPAGIFDQLDIDQGSIPVTFIVNLNNMQIVYRGYKAQSYDFYKDKFDGLVYGKVINGVFHPPPVNPQSGLEAIGSVDAYYPFSRVGFSSGLIFPSNIYPFPTKALDVDPAGVFHVAAFGPSPTTGRSIIVQAFNPRNEVSQSPYRAIALEGGSSGDIIKVKVAPSSLLKNFRDDSDPLLPGYVYYSTGLSGAQNVSIEIDLAFPGTTIGLALNKYDLLMLSDEPGNEV